MLGIGAAVILGYNRITLSGALDEKLRLRPQAVKLGSSKMSRIKRQRLSVGGEDKVTAYSSEGADSSVERQPATPQEHRRGRKSLFVRSLPASATSEGLAEFFSQSYPLKYATAVVDKATNQCKGFGFVSFADAEDARSAQQEFNGAQFQGRKIMVDVAEPRHRERGAESSGLHKSIPKADHSQRFQPPPKLIVRNIPWTIKSEDELSKLFMSYGKIKHVNFPKTKPGQSPGFGFIVMRGRKNAEKAIQGVNGKMIDGRTLAVDWAVAKELWEQAQQGETKDADSSPVDDSVKSESEHEQDVPDTPDGDDDIDDASKAQGNFEMEGEKRTHEKMSSTKALQIDGQSSTLFVRNVSFIVDDDSLREHFSQFGHVRYARVVRDPATNYSKGTGFVSFINPEDATSCLKEAPPPQSSGPVSRRSILEDNTGDNNGQFILDNRTLLISRAVDRVEAARLAVSNAQQQSVRENDKRRTYLLSEGTISSNHPLYQNLSPPEIRMREESAKQRRKLISSNPTLHLSLTRLSVRNLPRSITSQGLKALAREAAVGFAEDVKASRRKQLSKEELSRGGETMRQAERDRKLKGKGIVKQAKIIFEGRDGAKVASDGNAGRSRGYGFIEYTTHRWALMGLRWLNGHLVRPPKPQSEDQVVAPVDQERKRRLIVEFAVENAQVVQRRQQREGKARERGALARGLVEKQTNQVPRENGSDTNAEANRELTRKIASGGTEVSSRQRIIGRKRANRKARKSKASFGG
ncbi:uncharacterized protein KY384_002190 [Bacidia gigantensis]|uniref:uncharacterized protein n=1 Tax=Bacidia gigantensis TaxID=2732470 RepID=UPI001D045E12|nr:uncharacterized protein KY384_002190 [Bacidia gigantensis]KAG8533407.1 hypothetical protein KY384_002190 [Bacidia gigantensis]